MLNGDERDGPFAFVKFVQKVFETSKTEPFVFLRRGVFFGPLPCLF